LIKMSMFRTWDDEGIDWIIVGCGVMVILLALSLFIIVPTMAYDQFYIKPIADNNANDYCRSLGFDQYKEFSRVGILSKNPVAIKCEYAEKYTNLGVRSNEVK